MTDILNGVVFIMHFLQDGDFTMLPTIKIQPESKATKVVQFIFLDTLLLEEVGDGRHCRTIQKNSKSCTFFMKC